MKISTLQDSGFVLFWEPGWQWGPSCEMSQSWALCFSSSSLPDHSTQGWGYTDTEAWVVLSLRAEAQLYIAWAWGHRVGGMGKGSRRRWSTAGHPTPSLNSLQNIWTWIWAQAEEGLDTSRHFMLQVTMGTGLIPRELVSTVLPNTANDIDPVHPPLGFY
jgi:hypothetical protein